MHAQDNLLKRGGNLRRGTKDAADEAVRSAVTKPFLELSGNLDDYRQQVGALVQPSQLTVTKRCVSLPE